MHRTIRSLAVSLAAAVAACTASRPAAGPPAQAPVAVTVAPVLAIDTAERLEAGGIVAAGESASLSSRLVATVASVHVRSGDRIRAGQVLVTLDARDAVERTHQTHASAVAAEKAVAQARAEQIAAQADHRLAAAWQQRVATLHARNSATDQERDEAEARLAAAAARLAGTDAGVEGADAQLIAARAAEGVATASEAFTVIRAPFDGLVTERLTDPGSLATPGAPLVRVESGGPRQIVARVDEARALYVRPGDHVVVLIGGNDDGRDANAGLEGTVAEVARAVGVDQRTFTAKVALPITLSAPSGSFARVLFRGPVRRALIVPPHAIQRYGQVSSVYVVQHGVARLRLVQAGAASADGVEVLSGLAAGEAVVISPPAQLVDGAPVATGPSGGRS